MFPLFASGRSIAYSLLAALLPACLLPTASFAEVLVGSAAGVRQLVDEAVEHFKDSKGVVVSASYSSSGKLFQQILSGAPFDVFVSAHPSWVDRLEKGGVKLLRRDWAELDTVVWSVKEGFGRISSVLEGKGVYATVDPSVGPSGEMAVKFLKDRGVYEDLISRKRLVFLPDTTRVVLAVRSGAVDGALLAAVAVRSLEGESEVLPGYSLVATVALLSLEKEEARSFFDFMFSKSFRGSLIKLGARPLF